MVSRLEQAQKHPKGGNNSRNEATREIEVRSIKRNEEDRFINKRNGVEIGTEE